LAILIFAGIIFPLFQSAIFAASVKVVMEDATLADSTKESPILYIKNTGTDTLSNFYFYYYVTAERGNTLNYGTYYIPNTTVSMEKLDSVDYRLKFLVSSVSLKPNDSLQEQFALYYNYVNKVDKSNDYSYVASAVLTEDAKIPVYLTVNDSLIYGLDPNTPQKPSPKISAAPTTGKDSLKVQFTDSSTGTETSRLWTFGDGTTDTSKNPLHDYVKTGSFSVKLIVIGPGGKDSVSSPNLIVITATIPKPSSKISAAPTTGKDSLIVQFIDSSTGTITSRLWTFGDGTTDTSKNPLHDYASIGSFSVKLVVIGPGGKDSVTLPNLITITATPPKPSPKISASPTTGKDSLKVQFTDSSTGTITSRLWSFGDGTTDTSKNPLHDFTTTGSFSVKLMVIGPGGKDSITSSNLIVITATTQKPSPKISASPLAGKDSLIVQFMDSSTGIITSRLWSFGDGTTDTSKNPLHDYTTTGSFSVKLVVIGPGGKDSTTTLNPIIITATPQKPVPYIAATPLSGKDSLKVQFMDTSTGTVTSRLWIFGDGTTDTSKNPLHDYTSIGSFSVKLVVSGPGGKDSTVAHNLISISASVDTGRVVNSLKIKNIRFDTLSNAIKIYWTQDSTQIQNYSIGVFYSLTGYPTDTSSIKLLVAAERSPDSAAIKLGPSILFNTVYYVSLRLKKNGAAWSAPVDTMLTTPSMTWQTISYFRPDSLPDTAYAFNRRVRLCTNIPGDSIVDTLAVWDPPDSLVNGFIPLSVGFYFKHKTPSPAIYIGVKCDSIPKAYSSGSVRLYRFDGSGWMVDRGSLFDSATNIVYVKTRDLSTPFIAMIDVKKPAASPPVGAHTPVLSGQTISDTVVISDNIDNPECFFRFAKGGNSYFLGDSLDSIALSKSDTMVVTIPGSAVNADNGVRALFIVSDGVYADTVDLSRQVIRDKGSDVVTTNPLQWIPLHVTAMPDSVSAAFGLRNFTPANGTWKYDPTVFRLFRWYPCTLNVKSTEKWLEYSDAYKDLFSFAPGEVLWLKSRDRSMIDFGRATTPSLTAPFTITLLPGAWTDIALPFKFNINIGDVLSATAASNQNIDSLQWYEWDLDTNKRFASKPVYLQGLSEVNSSLADKAFTLISDANEAYSVYNPYQRALQISIPAIPTSMSAFTPILTKKTAQKTWAIRVLGRAADGAPLGPVYCGFAAGKKQSVDFYPAPPGLDNIKLRVGDGTRLFGHELLRGALDGQGAIFDLVLLNNSPEPSAATFQFEVIDALPEGVRAMVANPQTGTCTGIDRPLTSTIGANGNVHFRLAVGGKDFLAKLSMGVRLWRFDFLGAYPNPCNRTARIRYTLPASGIGALKLSIVGVSGKTVYETSCTRGNGPGLHEILWNGLDNSNRPVGAGVYILRLKAFNAAGNAGTFEKKMTFTP